MATHTVNWMWIGRDPQYNPTPKDNMTAAEIQKVVGMTATGSSEIEAVKVTGEVLQNAFQTVYNPNVPGGTAMSYTSPEDDTIVTDTRITAFLDVRYEITLGDGSTTTQTGVFIQMANGDMFFRPRSDQVAAWDSIKSIQSIKIVSAAKFADNSAVNKDVSFKPSIFDVDIVCFVAGTMIATPEGPRAVETLRAGDLVLTVDHGARPLHWTGSCNVDTRGQERLRPVRISAGALGTRLPKADLVVSPQHRVFVRSAIARNMFGSDEVLVAAKHLVGLPGIGFEAGESAVTYVHLLFDRHELVFANGAVSESLFTGPQALKMVSAAARREILALFPDLAHIGAGIEGALPARPVVNGKAGRKLADRHQRNDKPLVHA
ncbi:Hint domain-containing protein [Paracoccus sp. S1E-3]|uniref:Hint domain-containing protein n=1 Tax=Paracoccus sp. S1E-3 TaxID=2756130 RepID=UPI0015EE5B44|nr:Hint domain-containing protein [Paracoccus sp. S1E-3]MBA4491272.1 Hint domain-containing protein [Paracoccus sp. S1E-3]